MGAVRQPRRMDVCSVPLGARKRGVGQRLAGEVGGRCRSKWEEPDETVRGGTLLVATILLGVSKFCKQGGSHQSPRVSCRRHMRILTGSFPW